MTISRPVSIAIALALLVYVFATKGSAEACARLSIALLLPLACIWFGEPMGAYANPYSDIRYPTPGIMVTIGGWVLLAAYVFALIAVPAIS